MFGVTGLVLPPAAAATWSKEDWEADSWSYYHFWKLTDLPEATAAALAEHVAALHARSPRIGTVEKRFSQTTQSRYWATVCPACKRIQGDFPMSERRFSEMSSLSYGTPVRSAGTMIYRPWRSELTEDLLYVAAASAEVHPNVDPSWSDAMESSPIWLRYHADNEE